MTDMIASSAFVNGVRFDVSAADRRIDGNGDCNNSRLRILISESDIQPAG